MKRIILFPLLLLYTNCILSSLFDKTKVNAGSDGSGLLLLALGGASPNGISAGEPVGGGEVTSAGTTLRSSDGIITIDIPAGAVDETINFTISKITPESSVFPGSFLPTSDAYELLPSYRFKKPVNVSLALNTTSIQGLNLVKSKSLGFSFSSTSSIDNAGRFPSWTAHESKVEGDKVVFSTETFSIFGTATPPAGNQPPINSGAYYYFKPGCAYLPYMVRTQVIDPDGDTVHVYLITGPNNGGAAAIQMTREGLTNWYTANIPYEAMASSGIQMQVTATDSNGQTSFVPSSTIFKYPASSNDPIFIANYDRDQDNDGLLCAWERDNGRSDTNASDVGAATDSDGDGIPNSSDYTPNGEANPNIDSLQIFPAIVTMDISEKVIFGAMASLGGQYRYVNASYSATGIALDGNPVGSMLTATAPSTFQPSNPGTAGVVATVGARNATATVIVKDTRGPNNITNLSAYSISQNKIRLEWTAPGDDGVFGRASIYQIYRSTTVISNNTNCNGVLVNHGLTPKNSGLPERFDVPGLSPNTTYYFCIRAFDDSGNINAWAGTVSATTQSVPDIIPPSDIVSVSATSLGIDKVKLDWVSVGDDANVGIPAAYEIYRSTSPITNDNECRSAVEILNNVTPTAAGTPATFTVSNLADNTVFYFCVVAVDESGNYSKWNSLTTATTARANQAPVVSVVNVLTTINRNPVFFSGSSSSDPDAIACAANANNYVYSWTLLNKPPTSARTSADITGANTLNATFAPDVAGNYVLQLTFTDDKGVCGGTNKLSAKTTTLYADYIGYVNVSYEYATPAGYVYSVPVEGVDYERISQLESNLTPTECNQRPLNNLCVSSTYRLIPDTNGMQVQLYNPPVTDYYLMEQNGYAGIRDGFWTTADIGMPLRFDGNYFFNDPWPNGQLYKRVWNPTVTWTASGNVGFKTDAEWNALQQDVAAGTKRNLVGTRF
ncbi:fibronectin type III domain protein [Leptospira ryugenii]|uniref:Fibronectin type III domain protein n=1 Tax=Leptospira ryugenii TaxID=1917863 RepID=A0A2P2E237_9LEPT|nr:fibronectin type III domain-containing protein [Leptospira ryugenii]GBF50963.1 fibronectin type III domain protein [Leptospira ryugenii]